MLITLLLLAAFILPTGSSGAQKRTQATSPGVVEVYVTTGDRAWRQP